MKFTIVQRIRRKNTDKNKKHRKRYSDFFQDMCDQYDLSYFVAFGTLLGTIRHGGFIPGMTI